MIYLIVYDISNDKIRTKISKILIQEAYERLQLSVFLGNDNPTKIPKLWGLLNKTLQNEVDAKFYVFPLPDNSLKNMQSIGQFNLDIDYLLGKKETMLI